MVQYLSCKTSKLKFIHKNTQNPPTFLDRIHICLLFFFNGAIISNSSLHLPFLESQRGRADLWPTLWARSASSRFLLSSSSFLCSSSCWRRISACLWRSSSSSSLRARSSSSCRSCSACAARRLRASSSGSTCGSSGAAGVS